MKKIDNYKIIHEQYIEEVNSKATYYIHEKTGAKVLTLENDNENKTFGIGFRTPPKDSTGVAHIVEHCTLSGSRKYKTKEPFMDLIKSSLQTFLNAMTYPDKTIYPVSSRNEKDFYNLMDVYLDAVFYPAIYHKKEIFLQEGWNYEIFNKSDDIVINGVVYNEMKGVYSGVENQISDAITFNLHPKSTYGHDSGGNPTDIPNLTYENFLAFHKQYYHPSNSYIYLHGNMDMEKSLSYIDENYLSNFDKLQLDSKIVVNEAFPKPKKLSQTYSISEEEYGDNKCFCTYSMVLGNSDNKLDSLMRSILADILVESEAAPLKNAVLTKNLGEDFYTESSSSLPLDLSFILKNTCQDKADEFVEVVESTLNSLVKNGINKELLESTLNKYEFILREGGGIHQGVQYFARALNSWLYDQSPFDSLTFNQLIADLKEKINTDFFEKYIEEKIIENNFKLIMVIKPEIGKAEKEAQELKNKLNEYKTSLSDEDLDLLISQNEKLLEFQNSNDESAKSTIPYLSIEDIERGIKSVDRVEGEILGEKFLYNRQFTNGIAYMNFVFPIDHLDSTELPFVTILSELLTKMDTKDYNYMDLNNKIYLKTGGIRYSSDIVNINNSSNYYPFFLISVKVLKDHIKGTSKLLEEISLNTLLDNKKRIKELLFIIKSQIEASLLQMGHLVALSRVKSYYDERCAYEEDLSGLNFYFFLSDLLNDFDNNYEDFIVTLTTVYKKIINKSNLVLQFIGEEDSYNDCTKEISDFLETLPSEQYHKQRYPFVMARKNEGFTSSANVQYVSKGYNMNKLGVEFKGQMLVLSNILSTEYLHNNIRAKGGAYGAGIKFTKEGNVTAYSYRDPNLINTLDIYNNMNQYLEHINLTQRDLSNFIIGVMNSFDPLLTPVGKGLTDLTRYLSNTSIEDLEKLKEEALSTTLENLKSYAPLLKELMEQDYITVLGNEKVIKNNNALFNTIATLKR